MVEQVIIGSHKQVASELYAVNIICVVWTIKYILSTYISYRSIPSTFFTYKQSIKYGTVVLHAMKKNEIRNPH